MNVFDNLIDVNEASTRYKMTPQAIKQQIGKRIELDKDCKKIGNSWVFLKSSLDIIFRDKLDTCEKKQLTETEREMLIKIGKEFGKNYLNMFGREKTIELISKLNNSIKEKNEFIHQFLTAVLDSKTTLVGDFTYCIMDDFYPENCWTLMIGIMNGTEN